jgi:hypothetical protein
LNAPVKEQALYHLFGLHEGERFRVPKWPRSPVFRVEHASASDEDAPRFVYDETGETLPFRVIPQRNGGSYFVLPVASEKGGDL